MLVHGTDLGHRILESGFPFMLGMTRRDNSKQEVRRQRFQWVTMTTPFYTNAKSLLYRCSKSAYGLSEQEKHKPRFSKTKME